MAADVVKTSKFLSLVLRHKPDEIGLSLDENGWADVEELIRRCVAHGMPLTRALLDRVVAESDKKRFAFSDDGRIRASQGHSVEVDLALTPTDPPEFLYHGTAVHFLDSIRADGLIAGKRRHVHLSRDEATAAAVGRRHGRVVVLVVRARDMHAAGHAFYLSANGVWLADRVPVEFLDLPAE